MAVQAKVQASLDSIIYDDRQEYDFTSNNSLQDEADTVMMEAFDEFNEFVSHEVQEEVFCDICGSLLKDDDELKDHQRLHMEIFACNECDKVFSTVELLENHFTDCEADRFQANTDINSETSSYCEQPRKKAIRSKDAEEKCICNICGKSFKSKDNLNRHVTKHSGIRDFKCMFCPREFYFQRELNAHFKHQHFEVKKFVCSICDADFTTNASLKKHIALIHMEEDRKFECDSCKLSFKTKGTLSIHQRTHTKEKPFKCQKCLSAFSQKSILQRHMKNIHSEYIYQCNYCVLTFEKHGQLREHWSECGNLRNRCDYEEIYVRHSGIKVDGTEVQSIDVGFDED